MAGAYVGVLVVALVRFIQSGERRLFPVMLLFALLAVASTREPGSRAASLWHLAAGLSGVAVVVAMASRPPSRRP